jgi:mannose-6-phosphate isomerase
MSAAPLYPLKFDPIYQYRLWGGHRLGRLLSVPPPSEGRYGEAWVLSDRDDYASCVANGALKGQTMGHVLERFPQEMMGRLAHRFQRFPLLLKFLDVEEMLSVQVHPGDDRADLLPPGESGKTEAWVVLESGPQSLIYDGLKPGTTLSNLRHSLSDGTLPDHLVCFVPKVGDAALTPAGTVHSLGGGLVVFEIQENSDVTFRLDDWGHIDPTTGQPRPLQVEKAVAAVNLGKSQAGLVTPVIESTSPVTRERLFGTKHFLLWRLRGAEPFDIGSADLPRVLVCIEGTGNVDHEGLTYSVSRGEVWLLPAAVGVCSFRPQGQVTLLDIAIPE